MPCFSALLRPVAQKAATLFLISTALFGLSVFAQDVSSKSPVPDPLPSELILGRIQPLALRELATEILERNPDIARARFSASAAAARIPQTRAWPDPMVGLTYFALPPETRVGPQELRATVAQRFPWFGKLDLREEAAVWAATAAEAEIETARLDALTKARKLYFEMVFIEEQTEILRAERNTLDRFEEAARARYAAGRGLQQGVIRVQAQITKVDHRLLGLAQRRASLTSSLAALRNRPAATEVEIQVPETFEIHWDGAGDLRLDASSHRPEVRALDAEIVRRDTLLQLAGKKSRPDLTLGLGYTFVGKRDDPAGIANPPHGNGDDILALSASVPIPIWRSKYEAAVEESQQGKWAVEQSRVRLLAEIEQKIGDLEARQPLLVDQLGLLENVLAIQARESLQSAEVAYVTGKIDAVDLLDAEVMLFDVRTSVARLRADLAIAHAELERAVARPIPLSPAKATS